jgi:hypothetical protein
MINTSRLQQIRQQLGRVEQTRHLGAVAEFALAWYDYHDIINELLTEIEHVQGQLAAIRRTNRQLVSTSQRKGISK